MRSSLSDPYDVSKYFDACSASDILYNLSWLLGNLSRVKPFHVEYFVPALPCLYRLLDWKNDEVLSETLWALSYISLRVPHSVLPQISDVTCQKIVYILNQYFTISILAPACKLLIGILCRADDQKQLMIDAECLPAIRKMIKHPNFFIRKKACIAVAKLFSKLSLVCSLTNICLGGNFNQVRYIFCDEILKEVLPLCKPNECFKVRKRALVAISHALLSSDLSEVCSVLRKISLIKQSV